MEYHSIIKRKKKTLICATMWMNLKNVIVSKESQTADHILSDFLDMKCYEKQNYSDRNHISGYLGLEMYCKEI